MAELWTLRPFHRNEGVSLGQAAQVVGMSAETVRNWCVVHGIGRRVVGGNWIVSRPALAMLVDEDFEALRAYLGGDRSGGRVRHYFERYGLGAVAAEMAEAIQKLKACETSKNAKNVRGADMPPARTLRPQ